jgi:hypothetical protein
VPLIAGRARGLAHQPESEQFDFGIIPMCDRDCGVPVDEFEFA